MFRELILLSVLFVLISAYPIFPSDEFVNKSEMCSALLPNAQINGFAPQPSNTNPYRIFASSETYSPGKKIAVTIAGDKFIGALIQPFDEITHEPIGKWLWNVPPTDCNALFLHFTYRPYDICHMTMPWEAPETNGNVYFKGIVMKQFDTFWSGIVSELLEVPTLE